jgi:hypothetical protein
MAGIVHDFTDLRDRLSSSALDPQSVSVAPLLAQTTSCLAKLQYHLMSADRIGAGQAQGSLSAVIFYVNCSDNTIVVGTPVFPFIKILKASAVQGRTIKGRNASSYKIVERRESGRVDTREHGSDNHVHGLVQAA